MTEADQVIVVNDVTQPVHTRAGLQLWEYLIQDMSDLPGILVILGNAGWEAVCTVPSGLLFKRPKAQ